MCIFDLRFRRVERAVIQFLLFWPAVLVPVPRPRDHQPKNESFWTKVGNVWKHVRDLSADVECEFMQRSNCWNAGLLMFAVTQAVHRPVSANHASVCGGVPPRNI